jgi:hypothetical protein
MNSHKTEIENNLKSETQISETINHKGFLFDLVIYITVMFLTREVYFQEVHFLVNGLFWSFSTLIIATWRMRARNISWKDLGLRKPENIKKTLLISIGILNSTLKCNSKIGCEKSGAAVGSALSHRQK